MDDIRASISVAAACLGTDGDLRPLSPALCGVAVVATQASRHPQARLRAKLQLVKIAGRRARLERLGEHPGLHRRCASAAVGPWHGDCAAARFGPQGLRTSSRHDDPAAGDPARRYRHDVSAHAQRFLRGSGARHHRHRVACRQASPSWALPPPPWRACCWPRSGNGRPSWC